MGYGFENKGGERRTPMVVNESNCISRGRYISNIEFRKTDKAEFLSIEVVDKSGGYARKSYFAPKYGKFVTTKEDLAKEEAKVNRVIRNLATTLLGPTYATGEVASFEDYCKKVISDIGKSYYNKELRIKVVLDGDNRPTLPKYPVIFEDPAVIADKDTKMKITQWDKVTPTEVKMDEDLPTTKKVVDDDDLPFK